MPVSDFEYLEAYCKAARTNRSTVLSDAFIYAMSNRVDAKRFREIAEKHARGDFSE